MTAVPLVLSKRRCRGESRNLNGNTFGRFFCKNGVFWDHWYYYL